jgi:hypothetical protein
MRIVAFVKSPHLRRGSWMLGLVDLLLEPFDGGGANLDA